MEPRPFVLWLGITRGYVGPDDTRTSSQDDALVLPKAEAHALAKRHPGARVIPADVTVIGGIHTRNA